MSWKVEFESRIRRGVIQSKEIDNRLDAYRFYSKVVKDKTTIKARILHMGQVYVEKIAV